MDVSTPKSLLEERRFGFLITCCSLVFSFFYSQPVAAADPEKRPNLPWHLADMHIDLGQHETITSLSVQYQLFDDLPATGHGLFLAMLSPKLSGASSYAGVTTQAFNFGTPKQYSAIIDSGFNFTQFGSKEIDRIHPAKGGYALSGDYEGDLVCASSVGTTKRGVYTLSLVKREEKEGGAKKKECIIDAFVQRSGEDKPTHVGGLIYSRSAMSIDRFLACFCEVTQGWDASKKNWKPANENDEKQIPSFRYAVGNWQIDGKPIVPESIAALYPKNVPQRCLVTRKKQLTDKKLLKVLDDALNSDDTLIVEVGDTDIKRNGKEIQLVKDDGSNEPAKSKSVVEILK